MDFYFVKFFAVSSLTGEVVTGYMFGKKKGNPEYKVAAIKKSKIERFKLPDLSLNYLEFKDEMDKLVYTLLKEDTTAELERQFAAYFTTALKRSGMDFINSKMFLAVENSDLPLIKAILGELMEDWEGEVSLKVVAEKLTINDLVWLDVSGRSLDESFKQYLTRVDVTNSPEVYPMIDPLEGVSIIKLDVGDPIYVYVVDPVDQSNLNKLKELYPDKFDDTDKNIIPIEGYLISKEMIPNTDYYFIKVDLGGGMIGKAIISVNLRIMIDENKVAIMREEREKILLEDKSKKIIGDYINAVKKHSEAGVPTVTTPETQPKFRGLDFILIIGLSIVLILIIIITGIWLEIF